jgi:phosphomannomutase
MMNSLHKGVADFVGGTKGGFIFPDFQIGCDAMFTIAKIIEIMAVADKHLAEIKGPWEKIKIINKEVPCSWSKKGLVMRQLMRHTNRKKRILVDGVRFKSGDVHITIKPDKYRAMFYIQSESTNEIKAKAVTAEYSQIIKRWQESK